MADLAGDVVYPLPRLSIFRTMVRNRLFERNVRAEDGISCNKPSRKLFLGGLGVLASFA
jgi:hypothetical protein